MFKKLMPIGLLLVILAGGFWTYYRIQEGQIEKKQYMLAHQLVFNDEGYAQGDIFVVNNGQVWINLEFIKEKSLLDFRFSDSQKRILFKVNHRQLDYTSREIESYLRNSDYEVNLPIYFIGEKAYIELMPLSRFANLESNYHPETGRLVLDASDNTYYSGRIAEDQVALKMTSQLTGQTLAKLEGYSSVRIFKETSKAYRVRLNDGLVGYLPKDAVTLIEAVDPKPIGRIEKPEDFSKYYPIGLAWDVVEQYSDNLSIKPNERLEGLDVLSPTWFKLTNEGWVLNDADLDYTLKAHQLGYHVWPLFSNNFDPELTHNFLNSEKLRRKVIAQLIQYAGIYGFGGINLDFENVYLADKAQMTQFIEELSHAAKGMGLVLSVDVTVPWGSDQWSKFMDRQAIEPFIDYFVLMAYDEHWASSPKAGSVASLPWVEKGVVQTLELIPREKLILGLPLYMRVWTEATVEDQIKVTSKTLSIKNTETFLKEQLHLKVWDETLGQYFITYRDGSETKKVWIEDEQSLTLKLALVKTYNLGGAALWRKGFEQPWIWELMGDILKQ